MARKLHVCVGDSALKFEMVEFYENSSSLLNLSIFNELEEFSQGQTEVQIYPHIHIIFLPYIWISTAAPTGG